MRVKTENILSIKLITTALLCITLLVFTVIHYYLWPIYLIVGAWLLLITKYRKNYLIKAGVIATVFYLASLYGWGVALTIMYLPSSEILSAIQQWATKPHEIIWFILSSKGEYSSFKVAEQVRNTWAIHQTWFIPLIFGIYKLNAHFLNPHEKDKENIQGSAQFVTPTETGLTNSKFIKKEEKEEGFLLGWEKNRQARDVMLPLKEVNEHTVIVGAPGAGKSAGILIPNILKMSRNQSANLVVTDPKMEQLAIAGPELVKQGYKVLVFHPYAPELSSAWNMLAQAEELEDIDDMVLSIIQNSRSKDSGESEQWDQQAHMLLTLVCYDLRQKLGEKANMSHVQAMAASTAPHDLERTLRNSENAKIRLNAQGFFSRIKENPKIIGNIMSNIPRMFRNWTIDQVRAATSENEIDFTELCSKRKVALFIVTPMEKKEQLKPLFATFFQQLFKKVQEQGRIQGKLPRPLWFLLDEMGNLGQIPNFENFLTVVRGYNVGVTMGFQGLSQIEEIYGREAAKTILNSCANYIFSPRVGKEDADYFSEMMGDTTVHTTNLMRNRTLVYTELHYRVSEQSMQRRLQTPDEIRSHNKDEDLFVIAGNRHPMKVSPPFYFKDKRWEDIAPVGLDENWQKERLKLFLREEPLTAPGEERMMREAALVTSTVGEQPDKKSQEKQKQKEDTASKTGDNNIDSNNEEEDNTDIITRNVATAENTNSANQAQDQETASENPPGEENQESGNTANNKKPDPTTEVEVTIKQGNPFKNKK